MEIRDVLHGSIFVHPTELPIIDSRYFQRLRQIKQLGFAEFSYPSATHNRYIHSLGCMHVASQVFDSIFSRGPIPSPEGRPPTSLARFRHVVRLAALLHDVGHGPLSHTTETAMGDVKILGISQEIRKATHEDYTLKIILDSELSRLIEATGYSHGFEPEHVASLIYPESQNPQLTQKTADFFIEKVDGQTIDFRPILKQLISSEIDADRMDYLRRDSLHAGVSYGHFDFNWLLSHLSWNIKNEKCYLALEHRALFTFEDFLISRFHMFLMVYFHHKTVVYDAMLRKYFESEDCTYALPTDIEKYCEATDAQLYAHLAAQSNPWARRIVERRPYRMLIELHSGIPATPTADLAQKQLLDRLQAELSAENVTYLKATSTSELSKYFRKPGDPIFVRYDNHYSKPSVIPLEQCTDLFQRYSEKREITRLYIAPEEEKIWKTVGRSEPLPYEELTPNDSTST